MRISLMKIISARELGMIKIKVYAALQGGNFYWEGWIKNRREQILCCDDGVRPVVFLLERINVEE